jgi:hypothetical protein
MGRHRGFEFGIEAEFALVEAESLKPLWYPDLKFQELNGILEGIPIGDFATEELKVETPHRKQMPYVVEGYHVPDPDLNPVDILPKGIEIRTPVSYSPDECVRLLCDLYSRLQRALAQAQYTAVPISFHPLHDSFDGPQNKRRQDFWQWAMEAMVTYGPLYQYTSAARAVAAPGHARTRCESELLRPRRNRVSIGLTNCTWRTVDDSGPCWKVRAHLSPQRDRTGN